MYFLMMMMAKKVFIEDYFVNVYQLNKKAEFTLLIINHYKNFW